MIRAILLGFLILFSGGSFASATQASELLKPVLSVVKRYKDVPLVRMKVKKSVKYTLNKSTKKSKGDIYFSKGRFRLDIKEPEKSLMVLNDQAIWVETHFPEMDGLIQVSKFSTSGAQKKNALIAFLFENEDVWNHFKILSMKEAQDKKSYQLEPLSEAGLDDIEKLSVTVNKESQHLLKLGFKDHLGSETQFKFRKHQYAKKAPEKLFSYKPPEDAEVTIY